MSIMIADDNLVGAILLEIILQEQGYTTALVRTGSEALDCLANTPDITLVLSDVMMPDMDGLELLAMDPSPSAVAMYPCHHARGSPR